MCCLPGNPSRILWPRLPGWSRPRKSMKEGKGHIIIIYYSFLKLTATLSNSRWAGVKTDSGAPTPENAVETDHRHLERRLASQSSPKCLASLSIKIFGQLKLERTEVNPSGGESFRMFCWGHRNRSLGVVPGQELFPPCFFALGTVHSNQIKLKWNKALRTGLFVSFDFKVCFFTFFMAWAGFDETLRPTFPTFNWRIASRTDNFILIWQLAWED